MDDLITKQNAVIKASYRLSPNEQAIVLTAISKIDKNVSDQVLYELNIKELSELTDTRLSDAYSTFKKASFELFERKITLTNETKKLTRWIQTIDYKDGEGIIKIQFSNQILPFLTNLKENFTSYNLRNVAKFKSTYGVRIYELMMQWKKRKSIDIELDDLKNMFMLDSSYDRIDNIKRRVIEPALKDINNHSDINASYENIKKGRKITGFKFTFKPKKIKLTKEFIEKNALIGEDWAKAEARLKKLHNAT